MIDDRDQVFWLNCHLRRTMAHRIIVLSFFLVLPRAVFSVPKVSVLLKNLTGLTRSPNVFSARCSVRR